MSLSKHYNPADVEDKWYQHWLAKDYFHSEPDEREPYTIVIPPPNVTGVLHMGHMLNNTIQDALIRKARLEGKNACWVPGTDHASIATEAKVVRLLREEGIKKSDIGREKFLEHAFSWKEKYGGIILEQLKRLGASCDWQRTRFTMEESLSKAVLRVFVDLYRKGKIYRKLRMTNWDPEAQTVLSNEEVIFKEEHSRLYYVRYRIEGTEDEWLTIATVRPETILGDTAIAIHPKDERRAQLEGKRVIVPLANRSIPIIFDDYVDMDFGTATLKVTPAHDTNDYDIGQRHDLEVIDVLDATGKMSEAAGFYIGEDRFKARKLIVKDLEAAGHLVKVEDYQNKIGRSERTNAIIEPRLTLQWFVDMKDFAKTALEAVKSGEVRFYPENMWNMFNSWLKEENVRDWCISRQLWWGQRIPAWYYTTAEGGELVFVGETAEAALAEARTKTGNPALEMADLQQDDDVLDTWFSSWLWPISVFDGFERTDELKYYYPTNVLVTAWDIMFFWVARMIMSGYEWSEELLGAEHIEKHGRQPFKDVYFTGMVRDAQRQKMSKSLGNSPDALVLIDTYGADGVRFGMLSSGAAGNDIIFDAPIDKKTKQVQNTSKLCEQGRNFCNKMWNALKLIKGWEIDEQATGAPAVSDLASKWLENKLQRTLEKLDANFAEYRLSDALMELYKFIWDDFCSWYLEMIKPPYGEPIDRVSYERAIAFYERMMSLLHPFMPFVTEEIWHQLQEREAGEDCIVSQWPTPQAYDAELIERVEQAKEIVSGIRDVRNNNQIKKHEPLQVYIARTPSAEALLSFAGLREMISKMATLAELTFTDQDVDSSVSFLAGQEKYFVVIEKTIDTEEERKRLEKEKDYEEGFIGSVRKKLSNERFVNNAPTHIVELERKKLADGLAKIKQLEEELAKLV